MSDSYDITRCAYNAVAAAYAADAFAKYWMRDYVTAFCACLPPDAALLDLGCGPGHDAAQFVQRGMQVVGVDSSEEMIKEARRRVPSATFLCLDMRNIELNDELFDGIWSVGSLHHLAKRDMPDVLRSTLRLLKPGGHAFLSLKHGKGERLRSQKQVGAGIVTKKFWSYWALEEFEALVTRIGFTIVQIQVVESMRKMELAGKRRHEMWLQAWLSKQRRD